jgi:hypothetical protein
LCVNVLRHSSEGRAEAHWKMARDLVASQLVFEQAGLPIAARHDEIGGARPCVGGLSLAPFWEGYARGYRGMGLAQPANLANA